jgi:hypothetical protein
MIRLQFINQLTSLLPRTAPWEDKKACLHFAGMDPMISKKHPKSSPAAKNLDGIRCDGLASVIIAYAVFPRHPAPFQ